MIARLDRHLLLGVFVGALASTTVAAAGLSANQSSSVLGQPLDFPVQVRLDSAEALAPDCVSAEVFVADQRLPQAAVRTLIDQQGNGLARVRVQTQQAIDEPVISINLRVGCTAPISRRFVVFADPPVTAAPANPQPPVIAPAVASPPPAVAANAVRPDAPSAAAPNATNRLDTASSSGSVVARGRSAERPAARPARPSPSPPVNRAVPQAPSTKGVARAADKPAASPPAVVATAGPRLMLEAALPPVKVAAEVVAPQTAAARTKADAVDEALAAVAQAASAARMAAAAASASRDRIASLEQTVTQLRSESAAQQALVAQLRDRLDQAQAASSPPLWPVLLVALLLGGLAAWLAWRLGRLQAARQLAWVRRNQSPNTEAGLSSSARLDSTSDRQSRMRTGPVPFMSSDLPTLPPRTGLGLAPSAAASSAAAAGFAAAKSTAVRAAVADRPGASPARRGHHELPDITPVGTADEEAMARTEPIPAPLRGGDGGGRDVSIEELIDLEQQAEFFIVLGQDEAAVDLLVDHLRSTGGGSPLPYLKLLEIYSRANDRSAYERNRARFNHRFNAYAPEWGSDLSQGRSLEDYPGILPRLEQVWPRPLDAMAELEALLFRKSRGELFELPAYREVLFLYALARDLLDREAVATGTVDLLLPLTDGSAFGATAPIPFLYDEAKASESHHDFDERPTAPVDFDLTIPAQQTSMFDPLDELPRPRRH